VVKVYIGLRKFRGNDVWGNYTMKRGERRGKGRGTDRSTERQDGEHFRPGRGGKSDERLNQERKLEFFGGCTSMGKGAGEREECRIWD